MVATQAQCYSLVCLLHHMVEGFIYWLLFLYAIQVYPHIDTVIHILKVNKGGLGGYTIDHIFKSDISSWQPSRMSSEREIHIHFRLAGCHFMYISLTITQDVIVTQRFCESEPRLVLIAAKSSLTIQMKLACKSIVDNHCEREMLIKTSPTNLLQI